MRRIPSTGLFLVWLAASPIVPATLGIGLRLSGFAIPVRTLFYVFTAWMCLGLVLAQVCSKKNALRRFIDLAFAATCWLLTGPKVAQVLTLSLSPMSVESLEEQVGFTIVATDSNSSFLSVRPDGTGRIFIGCRESLLVVEPTAGGYSRPKELLRFPTNSWLNDIAIRGNDLYIMTSAALYLVPEGRTKHKNLECRRLIWGIPLDLHVSFHSLAWGPEGDLYFSAGDPYLAAGAQRTPPDHWGLWTLFGPNGESLLRHVGSGGVFRCRPDGSQLRLVAGGLRGPFGLAFDPSGNLFVCDNDHESRAEHFSPARLLQVVSHADFGWPRGWTVRNTPRRSELWQEATASLGPGVPVGLAFHEGFNRSNSQPGLLLSRWESGVQRIQFTNSDLLLGAPTDWLRTSKSTRPLVLAVDVRNGVYMSLCKMIGYEWSPRYPSEVRRYGEASGTTYQWCDFPSVDSSKLYVELTSPLLVRRSAAHQELLRRGMPALRMAAERWKVSVPGDLARVHLPWLIAAAELPEASKVVEECCRSSRDDLVLQGLRIAEEFPAIPVDASVIRDALASKIESKMIAGLLAGAKRKVLQLPDYASAVQHSSSANVLQLVAKICAGELAASDLTKLLDDSVSKVRLLGVVAVGMKLTTPSVEEASNLAKPYTHINSRSDIEYFGDRRELKELGPLGVFSTADLWRASRADTEKRRLYDLLVVRLSDNDEAVRFQAAYYLDLLQDERAARLVAQVWLDADAARLAHRRPEPIALARVRSLSEPNAQETLHRSSEGRLLFDTDRDSRGDYQLRMRYRSTHAQPVQIQIKPSAVAEAIVNDDRMSLLPDRPIVFFEPGTNDVLLTLQGVTRPEDLQLHLRSLDQVAAEIPPETSRDQRGRSYVDPALNAWAAAVSDEELHEAVRSAAPEEGRRLFGRDGIGCVRCHAVVEGGRSRGGPSLKNASTRFNLRHLVDSILTPSKAVDPLFQRTTFVLHDGRTMQGLVVSENADHLELLVEDGKRIRIAIADIEERIRDTISAMPGGLVGNKSDLLSILAYLSAEHSEAP